MRLRPVLVSAIFLSLAACGRDDGPLPPLGYAPADTPYVMGSIEGLPENEARAWVALFDDVPGAYSAMLAPMIAELEAKPADQAKALPLLRAIRTEFEGKTASQIVDAWGLSLSARSAVFGIDLVPVMRVELADAVKFQAGIERVAAAAGGALPTARVDELDYWYFQPEDAPLRLVMALQGDQLVATLAPPVADEGLLRRLLGLELPAKNLLDAGALQALNSRLGFVPQGSGYLDHARLFELFAQPMSTNQSAFLKALKITPEPLSEACLAEGRALTKQWPQIALGYTRLDSKVQAMRLLLEAPKPVMNDLRTLLAPTPGLDAARSAEASFSFAFKVDALPPLATKWASAVEAQPWACEALQPLNEGFAQMRDGLANPAVYAIGPAANSVHLLLSKLVLSEDDDGMPEFGGKLLIGSPNPQGLIALARNFLPQLAELKLEMDAEPVPLPTLPETPIELELFGAASANVLGIAVGADDREDLRAAMQVNSQGVQPLLQVSYQGKFYAEMMRVAMQRAEQDDPSAPDMEAILDLYERFIARAESQVLLTEAGIEVTSSNEVP